MTYDPPCPTQVRRGENASTTSSYIMVDVTKMEAGKVIEGTYRLVKQSGSLKVFKIEMPDGHGQIQGSIYFIGTAKPPDELILRRIDAADDVQIREN